MRRGSMHLVGVGVAAAAVGVLVASSASAVTTPRTLALHVTVNGSGTVRLPGHPAFTCHAHFPTSSHCRHTFQVPKGRRIVIKASPARRWKLWKWTGACHGSATNCSLRVNARRFGFVTASFVPPGDRLNPYPLGTTVTLVGGWRLKVNSVILDADAQVEAVMDFGQPANPPPQPGAQYTLVNASLTYVGGGSSSDSSIVAGSIRAEGQGDAPYTTYCIPPGYELGYGTQVFSGQTLTGNLCFEIASNDAASLLLTGNGMAGAAELPVWFALR